MMDFNNFYKNLDKKTVKIVKDNVSVDEYKQFVKNLKVVLKTYKRYRYKSASMLYRNIHNEYYDYSFNEDKIIKHFVANLDEDEFRIFSNVDYTTPEFKESYDYCKSTLDKVFNKSNNQSLSEEEKVM